MAVWEHLNVDKAHISYAIIGIFSAVFSLVSLFIKEKLYIGEATVAAIVGLIVGPHCLDWFAPTTWGNSDYITLELSRIVLCLQIFAVAVELPKKYMLKHWISVAMLLVPVMTWGWLIVGLFIWILIPGLNFAESLTVSACITATDPVLAAAVVGKGKFAKRVPGHLRNLLSAESGCNDGMAFPFIFLGINLVIHHGKGGEIVKDWILVTILYECILGCFIGIVIGYIGRHSIKFAEKKGIIDRESFLAFYIVLALTCAGIGSMLGVDDLLVSFAAGAAFSWDGWFARKTEETHVSTVIDLLLNLAYFVYFGAIIPWPQFNDHELGTDVWRLVILAIVVIFLRRIPAVLALKPFIPDIKTWREALFCGHFGPIGVGAVFAAILSRATLEGVHTKDATPLRDLPSEDSEYYHLIACLWPITTFLIIASIIVHGSSVAVITLGRHLNTMNISMSFTTTNGNSNSASWMSRLPELRGNGRSFSLHRIDTQAPSLNGNDGKLSQSATIETSGIPAKPAGGMHRKRRSRRSKKHIGLKNRHSKHQYDDEPGINSEQLQREKEAKAAAFALGGNHNNNNNNIAFAKPPTGDELPEHNEEGIPRFGITPTTSTTTGVIPFEKEELEGEEDTESSNENLTSNKSEKDSSSRYERERRPTNAIQEGNTIIIEDQHGEVMEAAKLHDEQTSTPDKSPSSSFSSSPRRTNSRLASSGVNPRYTAYKMNDQLIIENTEGEIIRRYKVNHHQQARGGENDTKRTRSSTVTSTLQRALSVVGIKPNSNNNNINNDNSSAIQRSRIQAIDVDSLDEVYSGDEDQSDGDDNSEEENDDEEEEDEEEEEDDEVDDDDNEEGDSTERGDEEETAAERSRRLAALGKLSAPRDDDDEEEDFTPVSQAGSNRGVIGSITKNLRLHTHQEEDSTTDKEKNQSPTIKFV